MKDAHPFRKGSGARSVPGLKVRWGTAAEPCHRRLPAARAYGVGASRLLYERRRRPASGRALDLQSAAHSLPRQHGMRYIIFCTPFASMVVSPSSSSSLTVTNVYPCCKAVSSRRGRYSRILYPLLWQRMIQPSYSFVRTVLRIVSALRSSFQSIVSMFHWIGS